MQNLDVVGRWLLAAGIGLVVIGGGLILLNRLGVKNIPGTIRFEWQGMTCLIPILGSILLSIVLTVVLNVILRLLRR